MSRKLMLGLAAIATLASSALISGSADAMVAHGNGRQSLRPPVHRLPPRVHLPPVHRHVHFRPGYERAYVVRDGVRVVTEGPCTCLTKEYTPEATVVFKDLCTKEMASAPVDGAPEKASEIQAPSNFAGKTYQDYLAANPQAQTAEKKN